MGRTHRTKRKGQKGEYDLEENPVLAKQAFTSVIIREEKDLALSYPQQPKLGIN